MRNLLSFISIAVLICVSSPYALCRKVTYSVASPNARLDSVAVSRPVASDASAAPAYDAKSASEPAHGSHVNGAYIFVPDTLQDDVLRLLDGHSKVVDDPNKLDLEEQTVHKGDTVPMLLKSVNLGRFDRGLSNFLYIPKGVWSIGLTASYGELGTEDLDIFGLLSDIKIGAHAFSIKPYVQYFIKNNLAVGLKFGYYNAKGSIDSFNVDVMEDMNFNLSDIMYRSESYSAALTLSQFLGLTRRGRFGVFNEVELAFKTGNSNFRRPYGGELRDTYTTTTEVNLNFSPGIQVFIMKNVAFHVSFGVFGFYLKNEKQRENDVPHGDRFSSGASFRFNLFNINFGVAVTL